MSYSILLEKYPEELCPEDKIDIKLKSTTELIGYLDISLNCFEIAANNHTVFFSEMIIQLENYAKERVQMFIRANVDRSDKNPTNHYISFSLFNNSVYYDANRFYQFRKDEDDGYAHYLKGKTGMIYTDYWENPVNYRNDIFSGRYRLNYDLHIIYKNDTVPFFQFLVDSELYESLYENVEKELDKIEKTKGEKDPNAKANIDGRKLNSLENRLNSLYDLMDSIPTNETLIKWECLLRKYIDKAKSILFDTTDIKNLQTKELAYILKVIFQYQYKVNINDVHFETFISKALGVNCNVAKRYLENKINIPDDVKFIKKWVAILTLINSFNTPDNDVKILMKQMLEDTYVNTKLKEPHIQEELEKDYVDENSIKESLDTKIKRFQKQYNSNL